MKLQIEFPFLDRKFLTGEEWLQELAAQLQTYLGAIADEINGQIGFGNGTDLENIRGKWLTYVSSDAADVEDTVPHGLTVTPIGYLVVKINKGAVIYSGTTAWNSTNLYLKSTVATTTALLFVLTAPEASS